MSRHFGHLNNIIMLCYIVESLFRVLFSITILALMTISCNGLPRYTNVPVDERRLQSRAVLCFIQRIVFDDTRSAHFFY